MARLMLLVLLCATPAHAQSFPKFTGFVVDAANVIPPAQETAIAVKLDGLQKTTGRQLIVATIPDLQGYAIEDYGYRLGRAWGVGLKDMNNGAILIVAPNARKVRVEVGYGLTPVLTDALSSVIIQTRILPAFRAGDMAGGVAAGADALVEQLSLPDAEAKAKVLAAVARQKQGDQGFPLPLVFWGIVLFFILASMIRGRGGRRFGAGPVVLWGPGLGGGWGGGSSGSSPGGGWMGGGFSGGGGGSFGGGGASGSW